MSQMAVAEARKAERSAPASTVGGVLQRKCDKCRKKKPLLRRAASGPAPETVPPIVHEVLRTPGQQLDADTRAFMDLRFWHDFSKVRIHTDAYAAESANAISADAYTVENHISFGPNRYHPFTSAGRGLLMHELTHVVQQNGADLQQMPTRIGPAYDTAEQEANRNAARSNESSPLSSMPMVGGSYALIQRCVHTNSCTQPDLIGAIWPDDYGMRQKGMQAAESARIINAPTYSVGEDFVFGDKQDVPRAEQGRQLVAHERFYVLRQIEKTQVSRKEESKPADEAEGILKKYKGFWGLDEEALGEDLLKRLPSQSDFILKVLDKLPGWNKDDVSLAVLEAATDEQIKSIATDKGGITALLRMVRELESGPTFSDEQKQIQRVMKLVTEVAPVKVEEHGKEPQREVEVITFRTGSLDWLGKLIGAKGHTAIVVGGYAYSFEWDWRCGQTKEEFMKANEHRDGVGQVLDIPDKDAIKLQKKLNESCSTGIYFLGGDICSDATAHALETVISGLKQRWDPQTFEQDLDKTAYVKNKRSYPKKSKK